MKGRVTLIGAGSGDSGLMTLKGLEVLKNADVVVYDRLVGRDILKFADENAEMINAGKKSANHTLPQEDINRILLEKALEGKNVVRLKGGDCFLFGRGGEELELLYENNIDFEVIPGITSALAVPAYAGIPVTHRDFVSSVHIITGHRKKNEPLEIDFETCVKLKGTLVFLMGVSNLERIADGLIKAGMRSDMPCAVIENGTLPCQRKVISVLADIYDECVKKNIQSPSIIVVGEVCSLSKKFDWFEKLPLKGKKVIVTRPKNRMGSLVKKLRKEGAEVIEYPCIETVPIIKDIAIAVEKIKEFDYIVFTSPSGVEIFFDALDKSDFDARVFGNKKIYAIGKATADELKKYFIKADGFPEKYDGKSLGIMLAQAVENKRVLLLRAENGSAEITAELEKKGIYFEDFPIYETVYTADTNNEVQALADSGEPVFTAFTSASTVKAFSKNIKGNYDGITAVCIGEKTKAEADKYFKKTVSADNAVIDELIKAIKREVQRQ